MVTIFILVKKHIVGILKPNCIYEHTNGYERSIDNWDDETLIRYINI